MSIFNLIPAITVAFAVTTVFMYALRPVAKSVNLVDRPGGHKSHVGEVPIVGGIAMFAGVFAGLMLLSDPAGVLPSVITASLLLVIIGTLDDKYSLPASGRFMAQIAAVLIMVYGAKLPLTEIGDPFGSGFISMGRFTLIFTMLVTLTMINAYNLIDGVDGLAGSLALIVMLAIAVIGGLGAQSTAIALTVAAAIVGFLLFNFPVAWNHSTRSFMGDSGSTFLGFTIVWVTLGVSQGPERMISPVTCLWFASIPIYDCLTCFIRRALSGKSPLTPGQDHFHHILKHGGMGVRKTLGVLTGLQLFYACVALAAHFASVPDVAMFTVWAVLGLSHRTIIRKIAQLHRHRALGRYRAL